MNISAIGKEIVGPHSPLKRVSNKLAAITLATGLMLSVGTAKANTLTKDSFQKENVELSVDSNATEAEQETKSSIWGGLLLGGLLAGYMGVLAWAHKHRGDDVDHSSDPPYA